MKKELSPREKQQLDSLKAALGSHLSSRAKLELLSFWARHPTGWSSRGAIAPHSSVKREQMDEALRELVDAGVIEAHEQSGLGLYGLRRQHPAYAAVLQLGGLTPKRRKYLTRAVHSRASPPIAELTS